MRDAILLRARDPRAIGAIVDRTRSLLATVDRDLGPRVDTAWIGRRSGFAIVHRAPERETVPAPLHATPDEAFAYTGHVAVADDLPAAVRRRLRVSRRGELTMDSPGGIAACFFADDREDRAWAWASHAGVESVFLTHGPDCVALSNRPLLSHVAANGTATARFSETWARRVLLAGSTLWNDTPFVGTEQIPPRAAFRLLGPRLEVRPHPVVMDGDRLPDRSPEAIDGLTAAALDAVAGLRRMPIGELHLSGGKDSRYVAALLPRADLEVEAITYGSPTTGEGPAAIAVAQAAVLPHRAIGREVADAGALVATMLGNLRRADGQLNENRQLAYRPIAHDGRPLIEGQAHHPRGGFRVLMRRDVAHVRGRLHENTGGDVGLVDPALADERSRRLDELLDGYAATAAHPTELAYWLYADWRMGRWTHAAYLATARTRPLVWPMMDERVLVHLARMSSFDRASETAFFASLRQLGPSLARLPLFEGVWRFDEHGPAETPFRVGYERRASPFREAATGRTRLMPEKRIGTVLPLFRERVVDGSVVARAIRPEALAALRRSDDPAVDLGVENQALVRFLWKAVAIELVLSGDWLA